MCALPLPAPAHFPASRHRPASLISFLASVLSFSVFLADASSSGGCLNVGLPQGCLTTSWHPELSHSDLFLVSTLITSKNVM